MIAVKTVSIPNKCLDWFAGQAQQMAIPSFSDHKSCRNLTSLFIRRGICVLTRCCAWSKDIFVTLFVDVAEKVILILLKQQLLAFADCCEGHFLFPSNQELRFCLLPACQGHKISHICTNIGRHIDQIIRYIC